MLDSADEKTALLKPISAKYSTNSITNVESERPYVPNNSDNLTESNYFGYSVIGDSLSGSYNPQGCWLESISRYRYYSRLGVPFPNHVLSPNVPVILTAVPGTQRSLVTIFVTWNTMMGTSLLSIPWAIQQSGFVLGILMMLVIAGLSFYTAYLILKSTENLPSEPGRLPDFTDACRVYLGRQGAWVSIVFSSLALLSGLIVYYVLLCNFLYSTVNYAYDYATHNMGTSHNVTLFNRTLTDVTCPGMPAYDTHKAIYVPQQNDSDWSRFVISFSLRNHSSNHIYTKLWSQTHTVPFWLLIIIFPLITIRSPTFFARFNAFGTIIVIYLFFLVIWKVVTWGIHMDFKSMDYHYRIPNAKGTFIVLTGVGSLAFFIHNAIHPIMQNQVEPKNNIRDLLIAYICVALTYIGIGVLFYMAFPFPKDCIQDNFLNNIHGNDILAFIGRFALFLQILTVLPLLMYILRSQLMYFIYRKFYPSGLRVTFLHIVLISICIMFAVYLPHIGLIARFSGALSGLVYIFALPALVTIKKMRKESNSSIISFVVHVGLIVIGVLNFCGQFIFFFKNP